MATILSYQSLAFRNYVRDHGVPTSVNYGAVTLNTVVKKANGKVTAGMTQAEAAAAIESYENADFETTSEIYNSLGEEAGSFIPSAFNIGLIEAPVV